MARRQFTGRAFRVFVTTLILGAVLTLPTVKATPYSQHPGVLIAEIGERGAEAVVAELNEARTWVPVTDRIEEGSRDWLMVGLALYQGADGGPLDDLRLAVNRALITNPATVIELYAGQVDPSQICWAIAEFGGHRTLASALREQQAKVRSLENANVSSESPLAEFRVQCLGRLRETESRLYEIYSETEQ